jgi:hypothetical protein
MLSTRRGRYHTIVWSVSRRNLRWCVGGVKPVGLGEARCRRIPSQPRFLRCPFGGHDPHSENLVKELPPKDGQTHSHLKPESRNGAVRPNDLAKPEFRSIPAPFVILALLAVVSLSSPMTVFSRERAHWHLDTTGTVSPISDTVIPDRKSFFLCFALLNCPLVCRKVPRIHKR